jgi:hypothetical protein
MLVELLLLHLVQLLPLQLLLLLLLPLHCQELLLHVCCRLAHRCS